MAEGIKNNEVISQQTSPIPIDKVMGDAFLDTFPKSFKDAYVAVNDSLFIENTGFIALANALGRVIPASNKGALVSLRAGMLFGYSLIKGSAISRGANIPVFEENNLGDFIDELNQIKGGEGFFKRESKSILSTDPIFFKTMISLYDKEQEHISNQVLFINGAIIAHYIIDKTNKKNGPKLN